VNVVHAFTGADALPHVEDHCDVASGSRKRQLRRLLFPFVILLIGTAVALLVRLLIEISL
jgi:hypothetical protein